MTTKTILSYIHRLRVRQTISWILTAGLLQSVAPPAFAANSRVGEIQLIELQEASKTVNVVVHGHDLGKCDPILLRDPKGRRRPILSLVFQDTRLTPSVSPTQSGTGNVLSVDAQQLTEDPTPAAQILVSLAGDVHYRLKRNKVMILVEVDKGGLSEDTAPPIAEEPAMPQVAPLRQTVQPGDVLFISVSPADELSRDVVVDQGGKISIPLIGALEATNLTTEGLARKLTVLLAKYVANPHVDVLTKQFNSEAVSLMGEVRSPGSYPYRANIRLLDVISMAGGFLPNANKSQIRVHRGTGSARKAIPVDISETIKTGDITKDFLLQPGDLIEVPKGVNPLTIFGAVEHGGNYEYYRGMRLLDLISLSLGPKDGAATKRIMIYRGEPPAQRVLTIRFQRVLEGRLDTNVLLEPGDVVYVPTRPLWSYSAAANAITPISTLLLAAATIFLAAKK